MSKQLDAVVFDRLYSYTVPYTDDFIQFPYESVYGNIEIKSFLNKDELFTAINNIVSFKKLEQKAPTAAQIISNRCIDIKGVTWSDSGIYDTFGVVFAYDSLEPETLIKHLRTISSDERISTMDIADLINPMIDNALHNMPTQKVARYK